MKKFILLLSVVILMVVSSTSAFAGGDKVLGEKGNGNVKQVQVKDPPPFN